MFTKNAPSFLLDSELVNRQLRLILSRLLVVLFITMTGWRFTDVGGLLQATDIHADGKICTPTTGASNVNVL